MFSNNCRACSNTLRRSCLVRPPLRRLSASTTGVHVWLLGHMHGCMCACLRGCLAVCVGVRAYAFVCVHACVRVCMRACIVWVCSFVHAHMHTHAHACPRVHVRACMCVCTRASHAYTPEELTPLCACVRVCMRVGACVHTCAHAHTCACVRMRPCAHTCVRACVRARVPHMQTHLKKEHWSLGRLAADILAQHEARHKGETRCRECTLDSVPCDYFLRLWVSKCVHTCTDMSPAAVSSLFCHYTCTVQSPCRHVCTSLIYQARTLMLTPKATMSTSQVWPALINIGPIITCRIQDC